MPGLMDDSTTVNLLLSEIQSVQRIYDELDEGVETNSQIHHSLLASLCGQQQSATTVPTRPKTSSSNIHQSPPITQPSGNHTNHNNVTNSQNYTKTPLIHVTDTDNQENPQPHNGSVANGQSKDEIPRLKSHRRHRILPIASSTPDFTKYSTSDDANHFVQTNNSSCPVLEPQRESDTHKRAQTNFVCKGENVTGDSDHLSHPNSIDSNAHIRKENCNNHYAHLHLDHNPRQHQQQQQQEQESRTHQKDELESHIIFPSNTELISGKNNRVSFTTSTEIPQKITDLSVSAKTYRPNSLKKDDYFDVGNHRNKTLKIDKRERNSNGVRFSSSGHGNSENGNSLVNGNKNEIEETNLNKEEEEEEEEEEERGDRHGRRSSWFEEEERYRMTSNHIHRQPKHVQNKASLMVRNTSGLEQTSHHNSPYTQKDCELISGKLHQELSQTGHRKRNSLGHQENLTAGIALKQQLKSSEIQREEQHFHQQKLQSAIQQQKQKRQGEGEGEQRIEQSHQLQQQFLTLKQSVPGNLQQKKLNNMSTDALRNLVAQLQLDLVEAVKKKEETKGEMRQLETKLEATENTVLHQSRKMKSYRNALEEAGLGLPLTHRSNSEASLGPAVKRMAESSNLSGMKRRSSMGNLHLAGNKEFPNGSMNFSMSEKELKNTACSSTPRKKHSPRKESNSDRHTAPKLTKDHQHHNKPRTTHRNMTKADYTTHNGHPYSHKHTSDKKSKDCYRSRSSHDSSDEMCSLDLSRRRHSASSKSEDNTPRHDSRDPDHSHCLHSVQHRRRSSSYYDSIVSNDLSQEAGQLEKLITHQVHLVVTQREEINAYESLLQSMGISLNNFLSETPGYDTQTQLVKQLMEVRNMRQQLESMDVDSHPVHPFMYQSHVNHLISHQQNLISTLKQQFSEEEEQWRKELNEVRQSHAAERDSLSEAVGQSEENIKKQGQLIEKQERIIDDLKENLTRAQEGENQFEKDCDKLNQEITEIRNRLSTKEDCCKELEKSLDALELSKQDLESKIRVFKTQAEDSEEERNRLRKELNTYKDTCTSLKDAVDGKDAMLHERIQTLQNLTLQKMEIDKRVLEMTLENDRLKSENDKVVSYLEEKELMKANLSQVLIEFDQKLIQEREILREKAALEAEVEVLKEDRHREKQNCLTTHEHLRLELDRAVEEKREAERRLSSIELDIKAKRGVEEEISTLRAMFDRKCSLEGDLRRDLCEREATLKKSEREKTELEEELGDTKEKVKKRDKQCQYLCDKFSKLDTAYTKQNKILKEKAETLKTVKRQLQLYEKTLNVTPHDNPGDTMKELLNELMLTKKQVADLMTKLEGHSTSQHPDVRVEAFGTDSLATTTTTTMSSNNSGSGINNNKTQTIFVNIGGGRNEPSSAGCSSLQESLFAILKIDLFDKIRDEIGECSVELKELEGRLNQCHKSPKTKSGFEEMTASCNRTRSCLEESLKILSLAWITELPPMDGQGNFYNPELADENENLKSEVTRLRSKCDVLDLAVKNQQGRLDASKQRHKNWEEAVYRQYELMFKRPQIPGRIHVTHYINGMNSGKRIGKSEE